YPRDVPVANRGQLADYLVKTKVWNDKTASLRARIEDLEKGEKARLENMMIAKFPQDIQNMMRKPEAERAPLEKQLGALAFRQVQYEWDRIKLKDPEQKTREELLKELAKYDALKPAPLPVAPVMQDVGPEAPPTHMPKKIS